jgi:hypothetical protein
MAITVTTLATACALSDVQINVTSATGFATNNIIMVDGEQMTQTGPAVGTVIPVQRIGRNGAWQSTHAILATVTTGLPADFAGPGVGWGTNPAIYKKSIVSYGADGAIAPPTSDTLIFINKATAAALTLKSPTGAPDGIEVTIYSNTTGAHTVTYTPGFHGDTTASDVGTFAATIGNSMTLLSSQGLWGVKCLAGVTLG